MKKLTQADLAHQRTALRDIDTEQLRCRVGGDRHWWDPREPLPEWLTSRKVKVSAWQCINCGAVKRTIESVRYGEQLGYRIWHPEGYLIVKSDNWPDDLRPSSSEAVRLTLRKRREGKALESIDLSQIKPGGGS